ncbi:fungal-specific transcription factor domain-containing protein [Dactylonectria macrodidyma]|uniref:Fungal-specific transcription factor domain-containing protein n=1 Tax=Dactylonectria macrodidyma TaxID=307937 RepID=A0A9P9FLX3_9HYPO|nr:fungal-specific transcription factor domain-containing protein [Dactylonectria macrodidyma]
MSTNTTPGSHKGSRILACVLCQHRKIKCDRNTPCSNCIKANVTCTPSIPAPARKRRRPNQDLQERLARCEELLKQYADGTVPSPTLQHAQLPQSRDRDGSQSEVSASTPTGCDSQPRWKPAGKMVKDDGGVRFMDSYLWASIHEELHAMREIIDTDDPEESSVLGSEDLSPDPNVDLLLPGDSSSRSIEDLQPDPVHIFRLWQIFLDRVNPLMKVIHVPSVQPHVMDATTNMENIPVNYQALLFSVFTMAAVSMTDVECTQMLGCSRDEAIRRFTMGTKLSLQKFNFLKNYDMVVLQSLLLYLISLQNRYDRHAAWIISGMVVRIAQKMGYHRDGESLHLTPFETEMRRRMWWQIILQDAKNAMVSGLSNSMLPSNWDTKMPQNVNDADLFPGSTEPLQPREGPTEMAFCLIGYQIANFLVNSEFLHGTPGLEAAIMGISEELPVPYPSIERYRELVSELEDRLHAVELRYIDASAGPAHVAALSIRPMLISKMKEMLVPMKEQPEWGTEILCSKDNLFKIFIMNNEHSTNAYEVMEHTGFLWFTKLHFQLDMFAVMTGQLFQRSTGTLVDRAWNLIDKIYHFHTELFDMNQKAYAAQAQLVLKAWKVREKAHAQAGRSLEYPAFIYRLQECLPADARGSEPPVQTSIPHQPTTSAQITDMDQFLGGYLDVSALSWDMSWEANNNAQQSQIPASIFGGFGMGGMH